MKIDEDIMNFIIAHYADSECVNKQVIEDIIHIRYELRNGITPESAERTRKYLDSMIMYACRKNAFKDSESKYDEFYLTNLLSDCAGSPVLTKKQLVALQTTLRKYVYPFCQEVYKKIWDYYNKYMEV